MVAERETMLGSTAAGTFGRISANSAFAGIEGHARIGSWRLGAGAELGTVRSAVRGGIPRRSLSPDHQRIHPPSGEEVGGRGQSAVLYLAVAPRGSRARQAVGSGRAHKGRAGIAQLRQRRPGAHGPADRPHCAVAPVSGGRQRGCVWAAPGHRNPATTPPPTPVSASSPAGTIAFETGRLRPASTAPTGHRGSVGPGRAERLPDTLRAGIASGHGFSR